MTVIGLRILAMEFALGPVPVDWRCWRIHRDFGCPTWIHDISAERLRTGVATRRRRNRSSSKTSTIQNGAQQGRGRASPAPACSPIWSLVIGRVVKVSSPKARSDHIRSLGAVHGSACRRLKPRRCSRLVTIFLVRYRRAI